jgi:hypothetical protein
MTKLTKPVHRVSNKRVGKRFVVITIAPGTEKREDMIGLRLLGERTQYVVALSDVYRLAAMWHGQKEAIARRDARKHGVPWRKAKKEFIKSNHV